MAEGTEKGVTLFFPVYHDEGTVRSVAERALAILPTIAERYELIIVNDCSPDRAGAIADELARQRSAVRVIHHNRHRGYGAALRTGIANSRYDWVCMIDGDDQYGVEDLPRLLQRKDDHDLVVTFRYRKAYGGGRILLSWVYNRAVRLLFDTPFRDISTGLRAARRSMLEDLELCANSTFIGAELAIQARLKGYRVAEIGVHSVPRRFGRSSSTTVGSIAGTIGDMLTTYFRLRRS
jgi:glycosyltransferase involved in cell wall biosynthesis